MLPSSSIIVVVIRGGAILLVKNKKGEWTLPGGHHNADMDKSESLKTFAYTTLYPFFKELVIHSVRLLASQTDMVFENERELFSIFEFQIKGKLHPEAEGKEVWFATIQGLPPHAVSEDIRGIISMLALKTASPSSPLRE